MGGARVADTGNSASK
jgi:tetratricopeptide (TPR) repeat protein